MYLYSVVEDELKYEKFQKCLDQHIWTMNWIELKPKIILQEPIELIKFICFVMMTKNIYSKLDTTDCYIFKNLLKSYKNSFVKHRQFVLVFSLNRTAFSSTIFPCYKTILAIILSSK